MHKLEHYIDESKLKLIIDHSALKWIWNVKSTVNSRLFKWSLLLNPLKNKVTIVHRPGRFNNNVDPLSRYPIPTYSITLAHVIEEWQQKLWDGYLSDPFCRRMLVQLTKKTKEQLKEGREPDTIEAKATETTSSETPNPVPITTTQVNHIETNDEDDDIRSLMDYAEKLKDEKTPSSSDETFSLIGKMLFFSEHKHDSLRLCIPNSLVDDILHLCHDSCGHPGHRRTYSVIALRYYFPKMSKRVKRYINDCTTCQISKSSHEKPPDLLHPIEAIDSYYTIIMDFITDLPISRGYDALLTLTDKFSKAIRLIPCKTIISTEETAQLYLKHVYPVFDLPVKFISNRDARFTSKFWSSLMKLLDVKLGLTAAFHPSADDQSERTNSTVETMIRCFIDDDPDKYKR